MKAEHPFRLALRPGGALPATIASNYLHSTQKLGGGVRAAAHLWEPALQHAGIEVRLTRGTGLLPGLEGGRQALVDVPDSLVRGRLLYDGAPQLKIVIGYSLQAAAHPCQEVSRCKLWQSSQ